MKSLNKDRELEGIIPPGFFVGDPEQEVHLAIKNNIFKFIEDANS